MSTSRPLPSVRRCDRCGGQMVMAPDSLDAYCPDLECHAYGRVSINRIDFAPPRREPTEPGLSVVLGRVVAILVAAALAVALWVGATQYGGWHPALAGIASGVIFGAIHDTLSAKVK